jgi:MarR family 2-MHQ and catechol resistance regulon transcriptional repressor
LSGNITLVIDNLEKLSMARRARSQEDRRFIQIVLTDQGRAMISLLFPEYLAMIVEEMNILDEQEQETLGRLCRKLGTQERLNSEKSGGQT